MLLLVGFNLAAVLLCAAILGGLLPLRFLGEFVRGLHYTIGITAPTDRQLRWTLIVWVVSIAVIADILAILFVYVF